MNIGFDAKRLFFNTTGLGNYSRTLAANLIEHFPANNYLLFTPDFEKNEKTNVFFDKKNVIIKTPQGLNKLFKSYWRSIKLEADLSENNVHVFHGLSNEIPQRNRHSEINYVVTIHDLIFLQHPEYYSAIDRSIYNKKFYYAAHNSDIVIATSQHTKKDLIELYKTPEDKIKVVYQSCHDNFKNTISVDEILKIKQLYNLPENYILSVGTIEHRKNLELVIKALEHIDIPLVVIGKKTSYFTKVIQPLVLKLNIKHKIIFLDNVSFIHLPAIYQAAELFLYPSEYEGFGIPVLEALYSKTPVITSNVSSLPEVGGENSLYVSPNNDEELKNTILTVLNDTSLQERMKHEGYIHAQKFSGIEQAKQTHDIYEQLYRHHS
jgi:glycosyltransferase involved in cell wall biosynthesis